MTRAFRKRKTKGFPVFMSTANLPVWQVLKRNFPWRDVNMVLEKEIRGEWLSAGKEGIFSL